MKHIAFVAIGVVLFLSSLVHELPILGMSAWIWFVLTVIGFLGLLLLLSYLEDRKSIDSYRAEMVKLQKIAFPQS